MPTASSTTSRWEKSTSHNTNSGKINITKSCREASSPSKGEKGTAPQKSSLKPQRITISTASRTPQITQKKEAVGGEGSEENSNLNGKPVLSINLPTIQSRKGNPKGPVI